jgi:hypothetical protein
VCVVDRRRGGRGILRLEGVQRVALHERALKRGERLDIAYVIEHDEAPGDRSQRADLAALHRHVTADRVQQRAVSFEHVVHRAGVRTHAVTGRLGGDLVPHLPLGGARRAVLALALAHALVLEAA